MKKLRKSRSDLRSGLPWRAADAGTGLERERRTRTRTIGVICKGSAKEGGHEVKKMRNDNGNALSGAGCGWNLNGRRKYLIFRELAGFFTVFHPFFTPYFSRKCLIFSLLRITHGYKRHNNSKCKVENAKMRAAEDANCANEHELSDCGLRIVDCGLAKEEGARGAGHTGGINSKIMIKSKSGDGRGVHWCFHARPGRYMI